MKLLCFGDLHLGAGSQYPGRLDDQRDVLGRIAGLAVERGVDGILFAGDAFEGPGIQPEQLHVLAQFVKACRTVDIPILAITGNGMHDQAVRETNGMAIFQHIPGITVESSTDVHAFAGCAVATLPWVHPGRLIARAGRDVPRDEVNRIAAELLVDVARGLREDCDRVEGPKILLGHWSVSGTALPAGLPVDELREPVLSAEALDELSYDALVFGHIHRAQGIGPSHDRHLLFETDHGEQTTYGNATAFYTGAPMPLNFGEAKGPHGVWILNLGDDDAGAAKSTFVPIDSPPFLTVEEHLSAHDQLGLELACARDVDAAIIRIRLHGTEEEFRYFDLAAVRRAVTEAGARVVKIEPTIVRAQRARVAGVDEQLDELAALDLYIDAQAIGGDLAGRMRATTRDLLEVPA